MAEAVAQVWKAQNWQQLWMEERRSSCRGWPCGGRNEGSHLPEPRLPPQSQTYTTPAVVLSQSHDVYQMTRQHTKEAGTCQAWSPWLTHLSPVLAW